MGDDQDEKSTIVPTGEINLAARKIYRVHFPEKHSLLHSMLTDCQRLYYVVDDWGPNTGLSILTGVNGVGKSQILKFLYKKLKDSYYKNDEFSHRIMNPKTQGDSSVPESFETEQLNLLYVPHNFMPKGPSGPTKDLRVLFIEDFEKEGHAFELIFIGLLDSLYKETQPAITNLHMWEGYYAKQFLYSIAKRIISLPNYDSLTKTEKIELAKKYALENPPNIPLVSTDFTMSFFESAFQAYKDLRENINKMRYDHKVLLEFYRQQSNINQGDFVDISILDYILGDEHVDKYRKFQLKKLWGSEKAPWEEINDQLRTYPIFKHKLVYGISGGIVFAPINRKIKSLSDGYRFEQLSTGEQMILSVLSWQYCQRGYTILSNNNNLRKNAFKSDVILLDEPDRHFDPKLSKIFYQIIRNTLVEELGIQVIMTTHRIDTIALAQKGEIFTVVQNGQGNIEIILSHKLLAMFRLTANLREFTNHHHKVYTESRDDALFYEGVYKVMMEYCSNLRVAFEIAEWQKKGTILDDLLSRRFQLSFMSVSDSGDGGGSCSKVIDYIAKDITAYRNLRRGAIGSQFYDEIELQSPYGIVDNDYAKQHDFSKIHNAEGKNDKRELPGDVGVERVVILKRHSLENYFFDPFILSYAMQDPEIIKIINDNIKSSNSNAEKIKKQNILKLCNEIYKEVESGSLNIELLQLKIEEYFKYIIFDSCQAPNHENIAQEIKKKIWSFVGAENNDLATDKAIKIMISIYNKVEQIFGTFTGQYNRDSHFDELVSENRLLNKKDKKAFYQLCDIVKPERLLQYKIIDSARIDRDIYAEGYESISVISIHNKEFSLLKYPRIFLFIRGHDIGRGIFGEKTIKKIFKHYIEKIYQDGLKYIPLDLLETIFELNNNVRTHVRDVLKPGKQKLKWSEKLDSHNVNADTVSSAGIGIPSKKRKLSEAQVHDDSIEAFQALYSQLGMRIVNVPGDGNCFFYAVEEQLKLISGNDEPAMDYNELRSFAHNYISDHRQEFQNFVVNETIDQYLNRMSRNRQWADHNIIQALSMELGISIVIIGNNHINEPQVIGSHGFQNTIYLGHIVELHYVSLERIDSVVANEYFHVLETQVQEELLRQNNDVMVLSVRIRYNNPFLNHKSLLYQTHKFAGMEAVNSLIELGNEKDIADQILFSINELGVKKVLEILFGINKAKSSDSGIIQVQAQSFPIRAQDEQTLETLAKIEAVVGKEVLDELSGWHQYVLKALSNNNLLSEHVTKVIQAIGNLVSNLNEWLALDDIYEDVDIENQVAIILAQLEGIFDFVASDVTYVGSLPRYPGFNPDDDHYSGDDGPSGEDNGDNNNNDSATNIIVSFGGQNITDYDV